MRTFENGQRALMYERRDFLRIGGGLAVSGSTLAGVTSLQSAPAKPGFEATLNIGGAKSCILVYLLGGPPHQDMFDLKPEAPAEIRGPFQPIGTSVPGLQICEHLPRTAKIMHQASLIRTITHKYNSHNPLAMMTGYADG